MRGGAKPAAAGASAGPLLRHGTRDAPRPSATFRKIPNDDGDEVTAIILTYKNANPPKSKISKIGPYTW